MDKWIFAFMIANIRYFLFAGMAFLYFYVFYKESMIARKIQAKSPKNADIYREILFSVMTATLLASTVYLLTSPDIRPFTKLYFNVSDYGIVYFCFSFLLIVIIHDTYFYWMHRAVHHPKLFNHIHFVHHQSTNPTPFTSFSFHPLEGILEIIIIPILTFIFPIHLLALILFILFMTIYNVYGHLGFEIYPAWFNRNPILKWLNTSVNHNMHHHYFKGNYGLYFRFWDEWMGTTHQKYDETFEKVARK